MQGTGGAQRRTDFRDHPAAQATMRFLLNEKAAEVKGAAARLSVPAVKHVICNDENEARELRLWQQIPYPPSPEIFRL
jgi:hypothetical protein